MIPLYDKISLFWIFPSVFLGNGPDTVDIWRRDASRIGLLCVAGRRVCTVGGVIDSYTCIRTDWVSNCDIAAWLINDRRGACGVGIREFPHCITVSCACSVITDYTFKIINSPTIWSPVKILVATWNIKVDMICGYIFMPNTYFAISSWYKNKEAFIIKSSSRLKMYSFSMSITSS